MTRAMREVDAPFWAVKQCALLPSVYKFVIIFMCTLLCSVKIGCALFEGPYL
jgi:hypothetical protein